MCGILGFITDKPGDENYNLLKDIMYLSSQRGTDASGLAITKEVGVNVVKEPIEADKFITKYFGGLKRTITKSNLVIGHTRLATQGHPKDNNNNHPVVSDKYVMVHNGTCPTMDRIKGYKYRGEVDSEILLSYVEENGIEKGLAELKGSASVAILPIKEPDTLYLWRHSNPLWVGYDPAKKIVFFASTEDILKEGLSNLLTIFSTFQMRQLTEDYLYKLTHSPLKLEILNEISPKKWGFSYTYKGNPNTAASYGYGYGGCGWDEMDGDYKNKDSKAKKGIKGVGDNHSIEDMNSSDVLKQLSALNWDSENRLYTKDDLTDKQKGTRYYFNGQSKDFSTNWSRLEGGGHISIDKKIIKMYDHEKRAHFLITVADAISEGLIVFDTTKKGGTP